MTSSTTREAPRFALHQRVRIIANEGGLYAAQIGVVGVISKQRQKRTYGERRYDVTYQDARGAEKIVIVREDDLEAVADAVIEPSPPAQPASATKPTKAPDKPPLFSLGEHVTVDSRSALCYESYTRKGAVGVIVGVGKPVRGIRRYDVQYRDDTPAARRAIERDRLHLLPMTQIREEHLLRAEAQVEVTVETSPEPTPEVSTDEAFIADVERSRAEARAEARARDDAQVTRLLQMSRHTAARWLAKWLITTDVRRHYSEQNIRRGGQGYSGALGDVSVMSDKVRVRRIGPHASWTDFPAGYDHDETFSLHALYEELRADLFAHAQPAAPRQDATARHAYEYRDLHPRDYHLWCDAGGSFIEACAVCRAHEGDLLSDGTPPPSVPCLHHGTHDWQVWPDGRYRLCRRCKRAERMSQEVAP